MYLFSSRTQLALATALFTIAFNPPHVSAAVFPTLVAKSADAGVEPTGSVSGSPTIYVRTGTNAFLAPTGAFFTLSDARPGSHNSPVDKAWLSTLSASVSDMGKYMTASPTSTDSPAHRRALSRTTLDTKPVTATTVP